MGVADPEGVITGVEEPTSWISDPMFWPDDEDEEVVAEDEGYEADVDGEDEEDEEKEDEGPQDEGLGGEDSEDDDDDGSEDEDDDEDGDEDDNDDELIVVDVANGQEAVVMGGVVLAMGQAVVPPLPLPPVIHGDSDSGQGESTDASTDTAWSLVVGHDDSGAEI